MPEEIASARLRLRWFRLDDYQPLCLMHADERVVRYLGGSGKPRSPQESWNGLVGYLGQWALLGYGQYAVEDAQGRFAGRAGIYHPAHWPQAEIAYAFMPEYWGRGFATEAVALLLDAARTTWKPESLVSYVHVENAASARVAAKNGATLAGAIELDGVQAEIWEYPMR